VESLPGPVRGKLILALVAAAIHVPVRVHTDEPVVDLGVHRDHSAGLEGVHRRRWGRCGGARLLHNHHREPLPRPATRQLILALVATAIHVAIITQAHEAVVVLAPQGPLPVSSVHRGEPLPRPAAGKFMLALNVADIHVPVRMHADVSVVDLRPECDLTVPSINNVESLPGPVRGKLILALVAAAIHVPVRVHTDEPVVDLGVHRDHSAGLEGVLRRRHACRRWRRRSASKLKTVRAKFGGDGHRIFAAGHCALGPVAAARANQRKALPRHRPLRPSAANLLQRIVR